MTQVVGNEGVTEVMLDNRSVNYLIMKLLWGLRNDKATMVEFYELIGINRNRFRRILNIEESIPRLTEDSKRLSKITNVSKDIFFGNNVLKVIGIGTDDIIKYLKIENDIRENNFDSTVQKRQAMTFVKEFKRKLILKLENIPFTDDVDIELYRLYTYLVRGYKFEGDSSDAILENITNKMCKLTMSRLESAGRGSFDKYLIELEKQYKMAKSLSEYRKYCDIK